MERIGAVWRRVRREDSTAEVIATVSHEIRSPLTTIKGFTKTLIDRWDRLSDDAKLEMLQAVNEDADRVTRLLTELLDVSRLEAGKLRLHFQRVEIRDLATTVISDLASRSDNHTLRLRDGNEIEVRGDRDKLRQVLTNFMENAIKYTDGGEVTTAYRIDGAWCEVSVSDEGSGIPSPQLKRVFDKFARGELEGQPTGTGLGLYICKGLVEAHGGKIGARSEEGTGSTFWFRVHLAQEL